MDLKLKNPKTPFRKYMTRVATQYDLLQYFLLFFRSVYKQFCRLKSERFDLTFYITVLAMKHISNLQSCLLAFQMHICINREKTKNSMGNHVF